jgi:branched-chain amino acid transport system permease protein
MAELVLQIALAGVAQGCLYALVALGLVMISNTSGVLNFAHGAMGMAVTYVGWYLLTNAGFGFWSAVAVAAAAAFLLGVLAQVLLLNRLRGATDMTQIVLTLGLAMLLEGIVGLMFGYNPRPMAFPMAVTPLIVGPVVLRPQDIVNFGFLLALSLALAVLFTRTRLGLTMRSITQNVYAARLMGVPVERILSLAWGWGVLLGGIAAVLSSPTTSVTPDMMNTVLIYGFAAALMGGFGSLVGACIGGLTLGVANNFIVAFLSPELSMSFIFAILLVVLYVRPDGLFGRTTVRKV